MTHPAVPLPLRAVRGDVSVPSGLHRVEASTAANRQEAQDFAIVCGLSCRPHPAVTPLTYDSRHDGGAASGARDNRARTRTPGSHKGVPSRREDGYVLMIGEVVPLQRPWTVGPRLDGGGFGQVYEVTSGTDTSAVAKFVPQAPGAERELLFVDLGGARNVVPVIDSGAFEGQWVLVMPRADSSLRQYLEVSGGSLDVAETLAILKDIADALVDLEGKVVHRDLKPENVLRLDGTWCLADFGISRYAEATTAPDTRKFAMSPQYAAPERWRAERASGAADVYAVGVMAYEMLTGVLPFAGPAFDDFRDAHLHQDPAHLSEVPAALAALVEECLYKAPAARPSAANLRARLDRVGSSAASAGLAALQEANRIEVLRHAETSRQGEVSRSETERRTDLAAAAERSFARISDALRHAIVDAAPAAQQSSARDGGWALQLNEATLSISAPRRLANNTWGGWTPPVFDVIAVSTISVRIPPDRYGYEGRSHSLWFGDVQIESEYAWFETAFMVSALIPRRGRQDPFALDPGEESAKAVWNGMAEFDAAWPFTPVAVDDLAEFIDRWGGWFAAASQGTLGHPSSMPERAASGSWRR